MISARLPGKWRAAALYTLLTLLLAYPISLRPDRIGWDADDPDGHLVMWLLAWDTHAFLHQPLSIFDANTFHPNRYTLAYQENLIGSAFFAAPVLWLTSNPVLAVNVVSLLACVLCGLGAYVLARRVGIGEAGALLCGVIFAFSPPRFLRFPQTFLAVVQWIPFALASLHAYFEDGRRHDLLLATAFFTLEVMSSGHGGVFAIVAIALLLAYRFALGEPILILKRLHDFGIAGALMLVPPILFVIPYQINQAQMGLRRGLGSWDTPIEDFFASTTRVDMFLQSLITNKDITATATAWLFPGYLPTVLALVAVVAGCIQLARHTSVRPLVEWKPAKFVARYKYPVLCLVVAGVSAGLIGVGRPLLAAGDGLAAKYYANPHWAGDPVVSAPDPVPSTAEMLQHWNGEPPANFSVSWIGYVFIGRPGQYFFATESDGASRVYIDNRLIVDNSGGNSNAKDGSIQLNRGPHRVALEYARLAGPPGLRWLWLRGGDARYTPVPSWALSRRQATYATVIIARIVDTVRPVAAILAVFAAIWCALSWRAGRHETWIQTFAAYRRSPTAFYLLLTTVCIALALGPPYGLWQFVYWMPGFSFIRASSRFMILGLLGIAVLAGIGFERLSARLAPEFQRVAAGIVGVLLVLEFAMPPLGQPYRLEIPAADRWVAQQPKPFVVAEVPDSPNERYQTTYMLHSMTHWQKTVHGYGGVPQEGHSILYKELETFPDTPSVQHLLQLDVTYVIVHIDMYTREQWAEVDEHLRSFSDWLSLRYSDPTGRVYALRRPQESTRAF